MSVRTCVFICVWWQKNLIAVMLLTNIIFARPRPRPCVMERSRQSMYELAAHCRYYSWHWINFSRDYLIHCQSVTLVWSYPFGQNHLDSFSHWSSPVKHGGSSKIKSNKWFQGLDSDQNFKTRRRPRSKPKAKFELSV